MPPPTRPLDPVLDHELAEPRPADADRVKAAPLTAPLIPKDEPAFLVDGHYWHFNEHAVLFVRAPAGSLTVAQQYLANDPELNFVRAAHGTIPGAGSLPVARGDSTTIGGIPVDTQYLETLEELHGPLEWAIWNEWILAKNTADEPVAIWKMPKSHVAHLAIVVEVAGALWICSPLFAMKVTVSDEQAAAMRQGLASASMTANVERIIAKVATGKVFPAIPNGERTRIAGSEIPTSQMQVILGMCGKNVEWLYTGPSEPVGARLNGEIVAFIAVMAPEITVIQPPAGASN